MQTIDFNGMPDGEYRLTTDIGFTSDGKRYEKDTYAPQPTLTRITMSMQDLNDFAQYSAICADHRRPAQVQTSPMSAASCSTILHTYVFEVAPKVMVKNERYFQGRVWVDDKDLQIVKSYGKAVRTSSRKITKTFSRTLKLIAKISMALTGFPPILTPTIP